MSRLDQYNEERRCSPAWVGEVNDRMKDLIESFSGREVSAGFDFWMCTKEIIYKRTEQGPELVHVMYMLDAETLDLVLHASLSQVQIADDQMLTALALALLNQIPVYPNTQAEESELVAWHERLVREGFKTQVEGKDRHFLLTPKITTLGREKDPLSSLSSSRLITPAEAVLVRAELAKRLRELSAAQSMLDLLDAAIDSLEQVLLSNSRNEHALQECISRNPVLFGPEYRRIIAKHRFGDDFEMDYAIERLTGFVDLVELESSTLDLYNKSGNPRKRARPRRTAGFGLDLPPINRSIC